VPQLMFMARRPMVASLIRDRSKNSTLTLPQMCNPCHFYSKNLSILLDNLMLLPPQSLHSMQTYMLLVSCLCLEHPAPLQLIHQPQLFPVLFHCPCHQQGSQIFLLNAFLLPLRIHQSPSCLSPSWAWADKSPLLLWNLHFMQAYMLLVSCIYMESPAAPLQPICFPSLAHPSRLIL
jgi:hypothetical protein